MKTGKFQDFYGNDYDTDVLRERLNGIKLQLFVGETDALTQPDDFSKLEALLPKESTKVIRVKDYNHLDYMWADDVDQNINSHVFDFINSL
jgi:hypothetical protein